jgi:hypothetical protein
MSAGMDCSGKKKEEKRNTNMVDTLQAGFHCILM